MADLSKLLTINWISCLLVELVMWYDVPGRDERWRQETLAALDHDLEKFKQEYECVAGETTVTVRDKHTGEIKTLSISELYDSVGFSDT